MGAFIYGRWHGWSGTDAFLLSDEGRKRLHSFRDIDAAISWLWLEGEREAARALQECKPVRVDGAGL